MFWQEDKETQIAEFEEREARRNSTDRKAHLLKHDFEGVRYLRDDVPLFMPIVPETPPLTVAMWTSICLFSLCLGWFFCSLFGYALCRMWKNIPSPDETASLNFIFDTNNQPLTRWAVNLIVSFVMMLYFAITMIIFIVHKFVLSRRKQRKFAVEEGWVLPEDDERRKGVQKPAASHENSAPSKMSSLPQRASTVKPVASNVVKPTPTPTLAADREKAPTSALGSSKVGYVPKKPDASARTAVKQEPESRKEAAIQPKPEGSNHTTRITSAATPSSQSVANKIPTPTSNQGKQEVQTTTVPPNRTQTPVESSKPGDPKAGTSLKQSASTIRPNPVTIAISPSDSETVKPAATGTVTAQPKQTATSTPFSGPTSKPAAT